MSGWHPLNSQIIEENLRQHRSIDFQHYDYTYIQLCISNVTYVYCHMDNIMYILLIISTSDLTYNVPLWGGVEMLHSA